MRYKKQKPNTIKTILLIALLSIVSFSSSVVYSTFPQHLAIDNQTTISSIVSFSDNNKVFIKGNQAQYNTGDLIPLQGREYIKITGRQVQFGDKSLQEGVRMIEPKYFHNPLFQQRINEFTTNQVAQISVDNNVIGFVPLSGSIIKIYDSNSSYNLIIEQSNAFLTSKDVMLRLEKTGNVFSVWIIGLKNYEKVIFTVKEE